MDIIKRVKIKDYKGLEEIDFPSASINVIVGPNNTGKSSILESIWMAISSLNNFEDALDTQLSKIVDENIRYIIRLGEKKSKIELEISKNRRIILDLLYTKRGYPKGEIADIFSNYIDNMSDSDMLNYYYPFKRRPGIRDEFDRLTRELRRIKRLDRRGESEKIDQLLEKTSKGLDATVEEGRRNIINTEKLFITSKLNNKLIAMNVRMDISYWGDFPIHREEIPDIKIPLIFRRHNADHYIDELYEKLVKINKLSKVLDNLKKRIPYFEDIRKTDEGLVVVRNDTDEPLPLSLMGDGFKALLELSFMAPLVKEGVVLFEEPETAMHPGYLDILADEIISHSKYAQFFISTHSLELVEHLLKKARKGKKLDPIRIIILRRLSDGYIDREYLSGSEALKEIETIKTDLRGI